MTTQPTRGRIRAAAIALCGIAAIATKDWLSRRHSDE